jgi:PAS domain S-box-containing protein
MKMKKNPANSEEKFRLVFESANVGKSLTLPTGEINVNKAFCDTLGYTREELENKKWQDLTPLEDIAPTQVFIDQLLQGKKDSVRFSKRYVHKNGSLFWGDVSVAIHRDVDHKPLFFITTIVDITEHKRAEKSLLERDALFAKITSQVPGMLYQFMRKPDGSYSVPYSNDGVTTIFGCSPDDVRNNFGPIFKAILPEDRDKVIRTIDESARDLSPWMCEYRVQLPGEPVKWLLGNSIPDKMEDGSIVWTGYNTDATDRKLVEGALQESEQLYRSLFDNMLNGLSYCRMLFDQGHPVDWIYLDVNRAYASLTGLQDVIGKRVSEVIPGVQQSDPEVFEILGRVAMTGIPEKFEIFIAALHQWFSVSAYSPEKEYCVVIFEVITERKNAEAALHLKISEMESFLRVTVGRELAMIELKKQINGLLKQLGQEEKYEIVE